MKDSAAILRALTPEARKAMGQEEVRIDTFPFRVGRESRMGVVHGSVKILERRKYSGTPNNDLYLVDQGKVLNISRQHFQIEKTGPEQYELVDRGSACGTIVGNEAIGGRDQGGRCALQDGNVIVVGTDSSPYAFKFFLDGE
jgi:pSer/pThr/pTyr-binding forkhead associated (FHA) protein